MSGWLTCFRGKHFFEETKAQITDRLVVVSVVCARCGVRKGRVEKI